MLFQFVLLSQVVVISAVLPWLILRRVRSIVETYPPTTHPKLYTAEPETLRATQRFYVAANAATLLAGLGLVAQAIVQPGADLLGWDTQAVLAIYLGLQCLCMILPIARGITFFGSRPHRDERGRRTARLQPRGLFDFVSPALVGFAGLSYIAFVVFVIYVNQFDYPWFGGYLNIVGMTLVNLVFGAAIYSALYGKRRDLSKSDDDRLRQMEFTIKLLVLSSILGTGFVALSIGLQMMNSPSLGLVALSIYGQIVAVLSASVYRRTDADFDAYRARTLAT